jgi:hypothetical protein
MTDRSFPYSNVEDDNKDEVVDKKYGQALHHIEKAVTTFKNHKHQPVGGVI